MSDFTEFYKRYLELCVSLDKTPSAVASELGFSRATATGWKNGKIPFDSTLTKIANYFNVSVDYLLGSADIKKEPVTVSDDEPEPSIETPTAFGDKFMLEALAKLISLNNENRSIALAQIDFLLDRQEKQEN
ncbi:MAG: helix-turn-helix transcriptional regulator [Clostridia bacterium]|nr:helix-turn-helix transcriptional regulator [Clostridia bacterium]